MATMMHEEGLDTFCRLPADQDGYPRPDGLEVLLHYQCDAKKLNEQEAKRRGEQWKECARRYPHAALAIDMEGANNDEQKKSVFGTPEFDRYVLWWAHYAGMDDPATAWRILGPGSPSWRRAQWDLLSLILLGVFGDEFLKNLKKTKSPEETLRRFAKLAGASEDFSKPSFTSGYTMREQPQRVLQQFFPDWDERWGAERYDVVYRIGKVEETFSFTPDEISDAVAVAAEYVDAQAKKMPGVSREDIADMFGRTAQNVVEILTRRKHELPQVLDENLFPREYRRAFRKMIRPDYVPRTKDEREVRSEMVFGMLM
jgi:hypothetical protein